jgi:hypothetical protein
MKDFRQLAKKETSLSDVMTDRTKVSSDELMEKYPDGFTIIAFDYVQSKKSKGKYPVFNIEDDPTIFCNAGTILTRIFDQFVEACDGDVDAASEELRRQGGLDVKLGKGMTKAGDDLVTVEIL